MKNMRKALLAAATATAVTLSGTAVANAGDLPGSSASGQAGSFSSLEGNTPGTPATDEEKDTSGSSDFGEVFGSSGKDGGFSFAQAVKSMKNITAFGTAVVGVLGVILTLSTTLPQVLALSGIGSSSAAE